MKTRTFLIIGLLTLCATHLVAGEAKGRIVKYGIFKRAEKEQIIKTPETPSGVTRIPAGYLTITTSTNRIPARKGVQFGMCPAAEGQVMPHIWQDIFEGIHTLGSRLSGQV